MKSSEIYEHTQLIEVKPGVRFSLATLKKGLPTVEVALFFAKIYKLNSAELGYLLSTVFNTSVIQALTNGAAEHSSDLQDYLVEAGYEYLLESGEVTFNPDVPHGEVLPEIWKDLEVTIANSIQEVADKISGVVGALPGKQGEMIFRSLMQVNAKRPTLGVHKAQIHHAPQHQHLLVFDVSGSMSEPTVETIVSDVVALGYMANMHLAIVSDTCTYWGPGEYDVENILYAAEYGGTHYETLAGLFTNQNWGVVVTIADYDSSTSAKAAIAQCNGRIEQLLDISLVGRPTYLSEVLGQLAEDIRPLLVARNRFTYGW